MAIRKELSALKVAVVHDWLTNLAGAEKVVLEILKVFPQADIYTSVYKDSAFGGVLHGHSMTTSFLQNIPFARQKHQFFPVWRRYAFESFDFSDYDLVISSSTAEAKGIITSESTLHIAYIHTPTRYFWSHYDQYVQEPGFGALDPIIRFYLRHTIKASRHWDYASAQRPDIILANSQAVQKRIKKYYKRDSEVVYPPVDISRFSKKVERPTDMPEKYFIVASRLVPYKRFDIAVQACQDTGNNLVVVGDGSELTKLKRLAGDKIFFKGHVSDNELVAYMQHAQALLFPGEEDFGIIPVEAMASGTPVIAYGAGGAIETVSAKTGMLVPSQSKSAFIKALKEFDAEHYAEQDLGRRAEMFSADIFQSNLERVVRARRGGANGISP